MNRDGDSSATRDAEFSRYATARAAQLADTAFLMCGDWHYAQDLAQTALAKVYLAWHRIERSEAVDAYAKRVVVNEYISQQRRRYRRERPAADLPETPGPGDPAELRLTLLEALARLTPKRRAVVVLRYWEDLSIEATSETLGMSASAVKSTSLRALAELRTLLGADFLADAA